MCVCVCVCVRERERERERERLYKCGSLSDPFPHSKWGLYSLGLPKPLRICEDLIILFITFSYYLLFAEYLLYTSTYSLCTINPAETQEGIASAIQIRKLKLLKGDLMSFN